MNRGEDPLNRGRFSHWGNLSARPSVVPRRAPGEHVSRNDGDGPPLRARQEAALPDYRGSDLTESEVSTVERLQSIGHRVKWIEQGKVTDERGQVLPANDFLWDSHPDRAEGDPAPEFETKATKLRYPTVSNAIKKAARTAAAHGVTKDKFLIDVGERPMNPKVSKQLADFNVRNPDQRISELWVLHGKEPEILRLI